MVWIAAIGTGGVANLLTAMDDAIPDLERAIAGVSLVTLVGGVMTILFSSSYTHRVSLLISFATSFSAAVSVYFLAKYGVRASGEAASGEAASGDDGDDDDLLFILYLLSVLIGSYAIILFRCIARALDENTTPREEFDFTVLCAFSFALLSAFALTANTVSCKNFKGAVHRCDDAEKAISFLPPVSLLLIFFVNQTPFFDLQKNAAFMSSLLAAVPATCVALTIYIFCVADATSAVGAIFPLVSMIMALVTMHAWVRI
jgi:hypothetical protein